MKFVVAAFGLLWALLFAMILVWPELAVVEDRPDFYTRQTARIAVLYWAFAVGGMLLKRPPNLNRWLWTLACVGYLTHVATAFAQVHHWSHTKAFQHVEETSGFGPGIFVSYGFSILWLSDVVWWWWNGTMYQQRAVALNGVIHGVMAFVVFNGTVVYETGFIRWAGLVVFVVLGGFVLRCSRQ